MKVTAKGQVTIPKAIRSSLDITANSEVEFRKDGERVTWSRKNDVGGLIFPVS